MPVALHDPCIKPWNSWRLCVAESDFHVQRSYPNNVASPCSSLVFINLLAYACVISLSDSNRCALVVREARGTHQVAPLQQLCQAVPRFFHRRLGLIVVDVCCLHIFALCQVDVLDYFVARTQNILRKFVVVKLIRTARIELTATSSSSNVPNSCNCCLK